MMSDTELLVTKNQGLVHVIVSKFVSPQSPEFNDFFSIGNIGLIKAAHTFDESKNIKFSTYSSRCITNEILMYLRKNKSSCYCMSLEDVLSCDSNGNELTLSDLVSDKRVHFTQDFENREYCENLLEIILNCLPFRDTLLILYHISGCTQKAIAEKLHISQSYISRLIHKIRQRLEFLLKYPPECTGLFRIKLTKEFYILYFFTKDVSLSDQVYLALQRENCHFKKSITCQICEDTTMLYFPADFESFYHLADLLQYLDFSHANE